MGHKHTRDEILAGALATALDGGLSRLTYGSVAKHLGITDRMVVYYFASKSELIEAVLEAMATELLERLAPAFASPAADHIELMRVAWPLLAHSDADPVFALFFEANGLAVTGREPYSTLLKRLVAEWIEWAGALISGSKQHRVAEAETAIAMIDGLLLLRQLAGASSAQRAARQLGFVD